MFSFLLQSTTTVSSVDLVIELGPWRTCSTALINGDIGTCTNTEPDDFTDEEFKSK